MSWLVRNGAERLSVAMHEVVTTSLLGEASELDALASQNTMAAEMPMKHLVSVQPHLH